MRCFVVYLRGDKKLSQFGGEAILYFTALASQTIFRHPREREDVEERFGGKVGSGLDAVRTGETSRRRARQAHGAVLPTDIQTGE